MCREADSFCWQNVALPCFLFSRIVPAIGTQNISALAPLVVIAVIYGVTGMLTAWIIKSFFWVPHRFRYGILAAGCWGNYGEIRMCTLPLADRPI
jgi:predicted permease